jgi:bifunctional DNA-binding transcriptional regulator/antitoxin component of YhaV-PrlF toxin-antitoxin module
VARVLKGGKVTVPKRLRELLGVEDGDYVRLGVVEVMKRKSIIHVSSVSLLCQSIFDAF